MLDQQLTFAPRVVPDPAPEANPTAIANQTGYITLVSYSTSCTCPMTAMADSPMVEGMLPLAHTIPYDGRVMLRGSMYGQPLPAEVYRC